MALDVSALASVRAFAAAYRRAYDGLDVLINNAGVMLNVRTGTPTPPTHACFKYFCRGGGCDPTYLLPPTDAFSLLKCMTARIHHSLANPLPHPHHRTHTQQDRALTADGLEATMATNHHGHFLLTLLLFPELEKAEVCMPLRPRPYVSLSPIINHCDHAGRTSEEPYDTHTLQLLSFEPTRIRHPSPIIQPTHRTDAW